MALPIEGPCEPWCTWEQVTTCTAADLSSIDDEAQQDAHIAEASELLYNLSGARYPGECEATRSICRDCVTCGGRCCCTPRDRVDLGSRLYISDVTEVVVDGVVLPVGSYHVSDWRWLVRDDDQHWPSCIDVDDEDAFSVKYTYGRAIPIGAQRAAAVFAAEIAADCIPGQPCNLPSRYKKVTNVQREGVSFTIIDSFKMLDEGRTGVYRVDSWLAADKRGRRAPAGMMDPGPGTSRVHLGS